MIVFLFSGAKIVKINYNLRKRGKNMPFPQIIMLFFDFFMLIICGSGVKCAVSADYNSIETCFNDPCRRNRGNLCDLNLCGSRVLLIRQLGHHYIALRIPHKLNKRSILRNDLQTRHTQLWWYNLCRRSAGTEPYLYRRKWGTRNPRR